MGSDAKRSRRPGGTPVAGGAGGRAAERADAFAALSEASVAGVIVWQEGVAHANGAAARLFGRSGASELRGKRALQALFAPASVPAVAGLLDACQAEPGRGGECEAVAQLPEAIGPRVHVQARAIDWGGAPAVLLTCTELPREDPHRAALPSEQRVLQAVFDTIPHHLFVKDAQLNYVIVNEPMARDFGQRPEDFAGRNASDFPFLSDSQRELFDETDRKVLETGEGVALPETIVVDSAGNERIWRVTKRPLRNHSGAIVGVVGESEDLTERFRAEQAVRDQQRLLQSVLDQLPVAVWVTDLERRHIVANRRMSEFCGAEPGSLVGTTLAELPGLSPELQAAMERQDRQVLETGQPLDVPEVPMTAPDGRRVWRHILKAPLRDEQGRIAGQIGICEDVTARKNVQVELAQMAAALEQAGDAVFITDLRGHIRYVNAAFERTTGYTRQEAIGQTPRLLKSGAQPHAYYAELWGTLQRGEVWKGRYTNRRKDGTVYHTHSIHSPIRDGEGHITGYLSMQRDVTQQMELDERMLRSQRLEALGTLAGGIAHDFNNVLVPIMGYTEMLRKQAAPGSQDAEWLQVIAEAARRARDLIARILLFSRQSESPYVPMRLEPVIQEVLGFLRSTVPATVELRPDIREDDWMLGDPPQMHQVLMNLCVNGAQAMPGGGILTVALDVVELAGFKCYLGKELTGRHLRVSVTDTGEGMSSEILSHIFEPFFTTKEVGQGTGLGLSTVFGIVRAHDGALRVQSAPGVGSTFELYFPVTAAASPLTIAAQKDSARGSERVLVVDDEPAIVELTHDLLTELGYRVTALTSSEAAMALLEADPHAFDAVITDQTMPELTGEALATRLRRLNPDVPILLCTGFGPQGLPEAVANGVLSDVLHKPYRPAELAERLRRLLDQR